MPENFADSFRLLRAKRTQKLCLNRLSRVPFISDRNAYSMSLE